MFYLRKNTLLWTPSTSWVQFKCAIDHHWNCIILTYLKVCWNLIVSRRYGPINFYGAWLVYQYNREKRQVYTCTDHIRNSKLHKCTQPLRPECSVPISPSASMPGRGAGAGAVTFQARNENPPSESTGDVDTCRQLGAHVLAVDSLSSWKWGDSIPNRNLWAQNCLTWWGVWCYRKDTKHAPSWW